MSNLARTLPAQAPSATPRPIRIDFVSDVSCPWCAVGLASLEKALEKLGDSVPVELHFQPFELNPQMGAAGEEMVAHIARKYGSTRADIAANGEALKARGATLGIDFNLAKRTRIYNTFDAHRLLHWAGVLGASQQRALKHAFLKAYFTDGSDVSDHELLVSVAAGAGLDAKAARKVLASGQYAAEVRAQEEAYSQQGIRAVPSVILDQKHLIQGGQPPAVFEAALRQVAAER